jgi:hypothetical protein
MSINGWIIHKKELGENHEVERLVVILSVPLRLDNSILIQA